LTRGHLLDASALLAVMFDEPGAVVVRDILDDSEIHTVNLGEAVRKLVDYGAPAEDAVSRIATLNLEVIEEFSAEQAYETGRLAPEARRLGLSLGDCVCLVVAEWHGLAAVTADRAWRKVRGRKVKVVPIR
jgi:PIN domain nuclease of toxin-antitoxin system